MRKDHRPLWLKKLLASVDKSYARHYLHPQFDALGAGSHIIGPRHVEVSGANVRVGRDVHMMATRDCPIRLSTFPSAERWGSIEVGDYSIVLPGVRMASALSIVAGSNCMFASRCYISDADWHDLYDRTSAPGGTGRVVLGSNVWIGDSAIVCKGVTIGDNSVVGAGAVVAGDIPENSIAVGNPARVVKQLDPLRPLVTRESLFTGDVPYDQYIEGFDRWVLTPNKFRTWLRSRLAPTRRH